MGTRRGFGSTRQLPSGRWQARYMGPDLKRHTAPQTFDSQLDAEEWLLAKRREVIEDEWKPPVKPKRVLFADYAAEWLAAKQTQADPIKPRTRAHYQGLLDRYLIPAFGDLPLRAITADAVQTWFDGERDRPTARANSYGLLHSILRAALSKRLVTEDPCTIAGAATAKRASRTKLVKPAELAVIVERTPERYRPMVLLAAWCGLRQGELFALRRGDVDTEEGAVRVERAVVRVDGRFIEGTPKSEAGVRTVYMPPSLVPIVTEHMSAIGKSSSALLFPAAHDPAAFMAPSSLYTVWYPAREAAGRPDLRFHDLRHAAGTWATQKGATIKEVMERLGHTTPTMALRYQHSAPERQKHIAERLDEPTGESDTPS